MRIGLISVNDQPTKKTAPGGTEVFVSSLAMALQRRGHEVTVIASGDSYIDDVSVLPGSAFSFASLREMMEQEKQKLPFSEKMTISTMLCIQNLVVAKKNESKFDILHENTGSPLISSMAGMFNLPIVSTLHMPISALYDSPLLTEIMIPQNLHLVSISKFQQNQLALSSHMIYNGIDIYQPIETERSGFAWVGRIDPTTPKGLEDAALSTRETGDMLRYVGFIEDDDYFNTEIHPHLHADVKRLPQFESPQAKINFYATALASIIPLKCEESFGYTLVESMASGTPVIAYAQGAATELIEDGVTGFLINRSDADRRGDYVIQETGVSGLIEAIHRIKMMTPEERTTMQQSCINHVRTHFSIDAMAAAYETYYKSILQPSLM